MDQSVTVKTEPVDMVDENESAVDFEYTVKTEPREIGTIVESPLAHINIEPTADLHSGQEHKLSQAVKTEDTGSEPEGVDPDCDPDCDRGLDHDQAGFDPDGPYIGADHVGLNPPGNHGNQPQLDPTLFLNYLSAPIKIEPSSSVDESQGEVPSSSDIDQSEDRKVFLPQLTDSGKVPQMCYLCGKTFPRISNLKRHMLTHTGERPHKCEVCGKGFSQRGILKRHGLVHSGEVPHTCDVCGMGFTQASSLARHQMTHRDERTYRCTLCFQEFSQKHHFAAHMSSHRAEVSFKCHLCEKQFKYSDNLKNHLTMHKDIDVTKTSTRPKQKGKK